MRRGEENWKKNDVFLVKLFHFVSIWREATARSSQ